MVTHMLTIFDLASQFSLSREHGGDYTFKRLLRGSLWSQRQPEHSLSQISHVLTVTMMGIMIVSWNHTSIVKDVFHGECQELSHCVKW